MGREDINKVIADNNRVFKDLYKYKPNRQEEQIKIRLEGTDETIQDIIRKSIEQTNLKPNSTLKDIEQLCDQCLQHRFRAAVVNPVFVRNTKRILGNSEVLTVTVIDFPLGTSSIWSKKLQTVVAIDDGADEVDMVINRGMLKLGEYSYVVDEIEAVKEGAAGKPVKVIIETSDLTQEEKILAGRIARFARANCIKTSTGFSSAGAQLKDIDLLSVLCVGMNVKASGGIKTRQDALSMIYHGATLLGTSSGVNIITEV